MRISDWSSDVCSSDLAMAIGAGQKTLRRTIDETRIALGKAVRTQPHAFERAGAEILDHHVGAVDQPPRRDHAIGALQVQAHAAPLAPPHPPTTPPPTPHTPPALPPPPPPPHPAPPPIAPPPPPHPPPHHPTHPPTTQSTTPPTPPHPP